MIQVDDLSIAFQGYPLFSEASFTIQDGERCGLVGSNGSGKSTLIRLLINKETPDSGTISMRKGYTIGTLDQHIRFTKPTLIEEAALGLRPEEQDSIYKAEKILFGLGFKEEDLDRSPSDFSGGFQLRLHLAKVLLFEPQCLLLDEPTNYLDILSIRWLTRFLQKWKGEFILISHDREFMDSVTTHTMGIHRQKVRKIKGGTVAFYEQILLQEEVQERTRQTLEKKRAHSEAFVERFKAKASKAAQAQSRIKMLERVPVLEKLKALHHLDFEFKEAPYPGKVMIDTRDVSFSYKPEEGSLIENLSISIEKGERIAIIGKNGYGKSTILKLLAGELTPLSGTNKTGENVRIGYFGQTNIDRLHPKHTITQEIAAANTTLNFTQVKNICGLMMFSDTKSEKLTSVLSGGERSRVLLGKILATPCNLLLLDEPTHHLDLESIEALIDALEEFEGAVVLVTHSELILKRLALDKIVICRQNFQETFLGSYEEFLEKSGWHDEVDAGKPKKKQMEQKDSKQLRAELINARSKALKSLEQQIGAKEKLITQYEVEQAKANEKMLECSQKGNGQEIQEISRAIAARQGALDKLYAELEETTNKRDERHADFTKQIEDCI